ncbi:MAG: hypothetical protein K6G22_07190 [Lachnospiraceae bacterium]|nr:hypothetical protein [Lachnospiraceae bacterium]
MKTKVLLITITTAILLAGCSQGAPPIKDIPAGNNSNTVTSVPSEPDNEIIIVNDDEDRIQEQVEIDDTSEEVLQNNSIKPAEPSTITDDVHAYAYSCLSNDDQRSVYDDIYEIISGFKTEVYMPTLDTDLIDFAFDCVLMDHPELFFVKGYSIKTYTRNGVPEKIAMSGTYIMDEKEIQGYGPVIDEYVKKCEATIPYDADEYTKVKKVYEYIVKNTEYDKSAPNNQNIVSVFAEKRSICQGYAKAMQYILNDLGIFCTLVEGSVKEGEHHVWDLVRIDGQYYHVDPTWGDSPYNRVNKDGEPEAVNGSYTSSEINYDYLCITTDEIGITHEIENSVPIPECESVDANYYVREGLYFTSIDEDALEQAFIRAYNSGEYSITIKCSDEQVYSDMKYYLFDRRKIFKYLRDTSVSYAEIPGHNEILIDL